MGKYPVPALRDRVMSVEREDKCVSACTCRHNSCYHKAVSNWNQRRHPDGQDYVT